MTTYQRVSSLSRSRDASLEVQRTRWLLVASILATSILYIVPYGHLLAYPLLLISTLAHEMGHGLAALSVGGHFAALNMWADGSGVAAWSAYVGRLGHAWVAAGGLIGPSVAAALCFLSARTPRAARVCLVVLALALVLAEVLVVRNLFGVVFVALLAIALGALASLARASIAQGGLIFLGVQLALSVFSRADYLFTPVAQTAHGNMPSDVAQIATALWLPYWFWGALCGLISLTVLSFGAWHLLRR